MRTERARPFTPQLAPITEHPTLPPTAYRAGDRVLIGTPDGYMRTGVVVGRSSAPSRPPDLWIRLSTGQALPLDAPGLTVLRRL